MLVAALAMGIADSEWRLTPFLTAVALISVTFHPIEVRHDGLRGSTILSLLVGVLTAAGVVYWIATR